MKVLGAVGIGDAADGVLLVHKEWPLFAHLDDPIVTLAGVIFRSFLLDETLVKTEVVANAVLPTRVGCFIVRKVVRYPFVDLSQSEATIRRPQDRHPDELGVAVVGF